MKRSDEQIEEIADGLDCGFRCFYHRKTGEIKTVLNFKIMENFIRTVKDDHLQSALFHAIDGDKPFRKFKNIIDNSGPHRQMWFDFKKKYLVQWVRDQAEYLQDKNF